MPLLDIYILLKNQFFILSVAYLTGKRSNTTLFCFQLLNSVADTYALHISLILFFLTQLKIYLTSTSIVFVKSPALSNTDVLKLEHAYPP